MKQELRTLISELEHLDPFTAGMHLPRLVDHYNEILRDLQELYPTNSYICNKTPFMYNMWDQGVASKLTTNCRNLLQNLNEMDSQKPSQNIVINIDSLQGNFSFENLISTIQNSNIGNQTEIINNIQEFRNELYKANPNKNKLKSILSRLESIGQGVIAGLLIEAGKYFLGL